LSQLREYGSYAVLYLRALPNVIAHGLRDPAHGRWLAEQIADHRIRPWPQHLDLAAWPWRLRVRTLGGFALLGHSRGGGSGKVQKAPLRLLKLLVAAGGRELPVSDVCEALWGDDGPAEARRNLDTTLHRLRALLGEDAVPLA